MLYSRCVVGLVLLLLLSGNSSSLHAADAVTEKKSSEKAIQLITDIEDMYRADSSIAKLSMRIETPHYQRTITMYSESLGTKKAFIRLLSPRKDRGISTLKLDKEMWNYFPKINKVIKVPPSMMMGSWMGSDFTNDDLVKETTLIDEYWLSLDETEELYIITLLPREKTVTVWGKMEISIRKDNLHPVQRIFYDDDGSKVRVMTYREPKQFGNLTLPSVMEMVPLNKEGHRTLVIYESLELNSDDVKEETFTLRHLKKRFR
ncbi:MAG: outer membrane lipoprotein-sorting protein [Gammaproteobacteria bacterium]|nr:outer membrane lipoprotein-sorting protein [Gammaproteobacteria bacterium]